MNATRGDPLADVVHTQIILRHAGLPAHWWQRWPQQGLRFLLNRHFTSEYLRLNPLDQRHLVRWYIPVIAARLSEEIHNERASLLFALEGLCRELK